MIGVADKVDAATVRTRLAGAQNWGTAATWIQLRTGTIRFSKNSQTVTGTGTSFTTELQVGDVLMLDGSPGTERGTVASITSNTSLELVADAGANANGTYGRQATPTINDDVEIGNAALGAVSVSLNVASTTINSLTLIADNVGHSLTHVGTNNLDIRNSVTVNQPTANGVTISWNIDGGSATVSSNLSLGGSSGTASQIARVRTTTGSLTIGGNLTFTTGASAAVARLDMSGGAGTLNIAGSINASTLGTLAAGTTSTVNFNGTSSQTIPVGVSSIVYNNIAVNNTSASGATLSAAISASNVTGNIAVQSGTLSNGGFAIAGINTKTFQVSDNATLKLTGTSSMVTGFASKSFSPNSTVDYAGAAQTVSNEIYGNLTLSGTGVKTMPASALTINGNLTMSGTGAAELGGNAQVAGDINVSNGTLDLSTFSANRTTSGGSTTVSSAGTLRIGGTNGLPANYATRAFSIDSTVEYYGSAQTVGSQTYGNLILSGSGVKTMSGAVTTGGNFIMSGTATTSAAGPLTVNGNFVVGINNTLDANSYSHSLKGNFTNSGTFTSSSSTFTFNGSGAQAMTGATTFNNLAVSGTSTVTTANALTINGNFSLGSGTTFNAGPSSHSIQGSFSNGGTFVPSTGTVTFIGSGSPVITGDTNFNNLSTSGTLTLTAASALTIGGNLTLGAGTTFVAGSNSHSIGGNFINNGLLTALNSTFSFNGSSAQSITASVSANTTFHSLTINNASGISLLGASSNITVGNVLNFTNGKITTGTNKVMFGSSGVVSGASTTSYVVGTVLKFYSSTGTMTFPVGDSSKYAPVVITGTSGFSMGSLSVSTIGSEHPAIGTSSLNLAKSVNRYWTLTASALPAGSTYDATFNFFNGSPVDYDSTATPASFVAKRYESPIWYSTAAGSATCTPAGTNRCNKITGETGFGDFVIAETGSSGLTCYNDDFNRADGAPGSDWFVGNEGGGFTPQIVNQRLRLTTATNSVSAYSTLQRLFPGAGNKIEVTFQHFAYGGTATGADGIGVILSDASQAPAAGAFGGSLGYAPKRTDAGGDTTHVGFNGGWIGIGIDEFGNYSTATEGRTGGIGLSPQSVAIRGSGSGYAGYSYLRGTTLSTPVDDNGSASPAHQYRIIVDHSNGTNAWTSIERDIGDGNGYTFVINTFDAKAQPGQNSVPANWNLSFTGATGGNTNIHEIDGLQICTNSIQPISLHHIELHHGGTGCGAQTVTVKACADEACSALYIGSVTVDLTNITGATWSADPVTITGGQTQVTLTKATTGAVTLATSSVTPTPTSTTLCNSGSTTSAGACTLNFVSACFDAVEPGAAPVNPIYTKLAGTQFSLDVLAVTSAGTTVNSGFTGPVTIDLVDPTSTGGNCSNTAAGLNTATSYSFVAGDVGRKTFNFTYAKAAKNVKVRIISSGQSICSKDNFAIRPQQFALSTSSALNPALNNSMAAGASFNLTANAGVSGGYVGTPTVDTAKIVDHNNAAITSTNFSGIFSNGTGTNASGNFQYADVGTITLNTNAVFDSGFTAVDQVTGTVNGINHGTAGDCVAASSSNTLASSKYGCNIGAPAVSPSPTVALGPLGRFRPDHYEVTATLTPACNGFTYMGQSALGIDLAVRAMSSSGVQLAKYTTGGNFSTLCAPQSCLATLNVAGDNSGTAITPLSSWLTPVLPSFTWTNGGYSASGSTYSFARLGSPEGPYDNFALNVAVTDTDGAFITKLNNINIANASSVLSGTTKLRYGRLLIDNTFGSDKLNLPVNITAQYWDSSQSRYVTNTDDNNCTVLTSGGNLKFANYIGGISSTNMGDSHIPASTSLTNGKATIILAKPSPTPSSKGSADLTSQLNYLPGYGRETFGLYKGGPILYLRERY